MAQHIPIEKIENKVFRLIENSIRKNRYFKTSFKFFDIPYDEYKETLTDEVYACTYSVPKSIGVGHRGYFEIHTEPNKIGRRVTNIYLVV